MNVHLKRLVDGEKKTQKKDALRAKKNIKKIYLDTRRYGASVYWPIKKKTPMRANTIKSIAKNVSAIMLKSIVLIRFGALRFWRHRQKGEPLKMGPEDFLRRMIFSKN